ncbi:MAG: thymidylate kinase [Verrucomicrobiota bacterium]|nr:thymidylate kinase [Verrucomicrobiota bacterium]
MNQKRFFGQGLPRLDLSKLTGKLIVIEGADGSGRSVQIAKLTEWLEAKGHAVAHVGLRRSTLVSEELEQAKQGNILGKTTMSLFYATDFADQLENRIIPALRAGFIVLADRYIYTLMARDIVRGSEVNWVESLYGIALVPDAVFFLHTGARQLVERNFQKNGRLDYWESGMDLGLANNMFDSFIRYQKKIQHEYKWMEEKYGFKVVNGNRSIQSILKDFKSHLLPLIDPTDPDLAGNKL